jgi:hypothetical protein
MLTGMRTSPCLTVWKEKGIFDRSPRTPHNHGLRITTVLDQRGGDLGDLILGMGAGVLGIRLQPRDRPLFDLLGAKAKGQGKMSLRRRGGECRGWMPGSRSGGSQSGSRNPAGSQPGVQLKPLFHKRKKPPLGGFWMRWLPKIWRCRYRTSATSPPA